MGFLAPLIPYLIGAVAVGGAYAWAHHRGVADEHVKTVAVQTAFDAYRAQAERQAEEARRAAVALSQRWDSERTAAGEKYAASERARKAAANALAARVASLRDTRDCSITPAAADVLRDASASANAGKSTEAAGPAGGDPQPAPAVSAVSEQQIAGAWIEAADAYRDAREHWAGCVSFVDGLRAAQ